MHLLVIEDDPRLSRLLKRLLEDDRHVVELATDGTTGLELAEDAPGIECVILDVGLPDISGLEVARRLRAEGSDVPILMLTARDTVGDRVSGLDAGADDYLVKPFAFEELSARLRAMARRSTGRPRPAADRPEPDGRRHRPRRDGATGDRRRDRRSTSARASSRCSSACSGTSARRSPATSSSTRPGRSGWP